MPKLYGYTEGDAQRIRKTVLNDERTKTLAPWRHTPILNGENDEYTGPFAVRIIEKEGKAGEDSKLMLSVNGGYVNGNGIHIEMIEGAELELSAGYVCVHLGIDAQGNWQTPEFVVTAEPTVNDYPVALLELLPDGKTYQIHQARVLLAVIMISDLCPLAEF
nr:MAG TPA: hypothetical protein [Caudoviricetes sp.]DAR00134.1 MAG TPA: hypothetical protein [Caudoviricetes sp.]